MVKAKDLQDAKVYKVKFGDKIRPMTFDYNAVGELQELGYLEPFEAIQGIEMGNVKAISALFYASFVAGLMTEDENTFFEMTRAEVGRKLGTYMMKDNEYYQTLMTKLSESITSFFPEVKEEKQDKKKEVDEKN